MIEICKMFLQGYQVNCFENYYKAYAERA